MQFPTPNPVQRATLMVALLSFVAATFGQATKPTPTSVSVGYDDGSKVAATALTPDQAAAVGKLFPPAPPATPDPSIVGVRVLAYPSNAVMVPAGAGDATVDLKEGERIYLDAVAANSPTAVLWKVNAATATETAAPWTYGLQFQPIGWAAEPGTYAVAATPRDADGNVGQAFTFKLIVRRPVTAPAATYTGTLKWDGAKWAESWMFPLDDDGWIVYPRSATTVDIYVSPTAGDDVNPGTKDRPLKTLAKVKVPADRQWCLWLAGGVNHGALPVLRSGTRQYPNVVRSYGTGRAQVAPVLAMRQRGLAFVDLKVVGDGVPAIDANHTALPAMNFYNFSEVAVEGCDVSESINGIVAQGDATCDDFIVRRSIIHDNHADPKNTAHSQGLYVFNLNGFLDEDNVYDANGWKKGYASPTQFNQNRYINAQNANVVTRNLFTANAAGTGTQQRAGGVLQWMVGIDNPNQITYGLVNGDGPHTKGGVIGGLSHIVLQTGTPLIPGMGNMLTLGNIRQVTVSDIIALGSPTWAVSIENGHGLHQADAVGIRDLTMERVIGWNCKYSMIVENSFVKKPAGYDSWGKVIVRNCYLPNSTLRFGEQQVQPMSGRFKDASRDVDAYARTIGLKDRADLARAERLQARGNWRKELEPRTIVAWIEEGFQPN